jgi:hypothetical protein
LWTLLKEIISDNSGFQTLEVEHDFPAIDVGRSCSTHAGYLEKVIPDT